MHIFTNSSDSSVSSWCISRKITKRCGKCCPKYVSGSESSTCSLHLILWVSSLTNLDYSLSISHNIKEVLYIYNWCEHLLNSHIFVVENSYFTANELILYYNNVWQKHDDMYVIWLYVFVYYITIKKIP